MAAATGDICRVRDEIPESAPPEMTVQLASTTIYAGALAMQVAGKARPYVSGTASSTLLGFAQTRYTNTAGTDKTYADDAPMVFQRGTFWLPGKAGDLPTEADIDKPVYFDDSSGTVKHTAATNDLSGTLRGIREGLYRVEI